MTRSILILDDDETFRRLIAKVVSGHGYEVLEAGSGAEADEVVRDREPDFALVDQLLPDTLGSRWLERLRERGMTLPAALVSAMWRDLTDFAELTTRLGLTWVLYKPLDPVLLLKRLKEHFGEASGTHVEEATDLAAKLAELRREYQRTLPAKLSALGAMVGRFRQAPVDDALKDRAATAAHRLRGTAGSYGFAQVGNAAGRVENLIEEGCPESTRERTQWWDDLESAVDEARSFAAVTEQKAATTTRADRFGGRVLLVDDDPDFVRFVTKIAHSNFLEIVPASDASEALHKASSRHLDAAIVDVVLGERRAFDLATKLRELPGNADLPLAFVSVHDEISDRIAAVHAGAMTYLTKPVESARFLDSMQQLLRSREDRRFRVLLVEDDPDAAAFVSSVLGSEGISVVTEHEPGNTIKTLEDVRPDLLLLDLLMPDFDGRDVCRAVRASPVWQTLPIVFVTIRGDRATRLDAYRAGGDDYLSKPVLPEELIARVHVRLERARLLRERAERDALTGLPSRRTFVDAAEARLAEARRRESIMGLCILDLDQFKEVNDTHGHLVGDRVLAQFGQLLRHRFRTYDLRARWGGEEFVLLFPGEDGASVAALVDRLRQDFAELDHEAEDGSFFRVTFTAGVASAPVDGSSLQALVARADARMYEGKAGGRNRVIGP